MAKAMTGGLYTGDTVTYQYDNDGALAKTVDSETGVETAWYYDTTGRLTKHTEKGSGREYSISYEYDDKNNVTKTVEKANGNTVTQTYDYDMDNRPTAVHVTKVVGMDTQIHHILYFYDTLGRLQEQRIVNDDSYHGPIGTNWGAVQYAYTYVGAEGSTAPQISNVVMSGPNMQEQFTYTYDSTGNIATAYEGLSPFSGTVTYGYDVLNEVVSEQNGTAGIDWTYYYDNSGNITHVIGRDIDDIRTQVERNTYTYGNSEWGDLLTAYNGTAITYDQIGNRLSDGTWTYTWEHGRELATMTKNNSSSSWDFSYDANGLRTQRTDYNHYNYYYGAYEHYEYQYDSSGRLIYMDHMGDTMYFSYDPVTGFPQTMIRSGMVFYYVTNSRGDVMAILDDSGNYCAVYEYDAWGNVLYASDCNDWIIAEYNPLLYRGYVYDWETGLYYVSSRYYDPEIGRWISPEPNVYEGTFDGGAGLVGYNVYAYCANSPVIFKDATGESIMLTCILVGTCIGLIGGGFFGAYRASCNGYSVDSGWNYWQYVVGYGAAGGALGALGGWAFSGTSAAASMSWGIHKLTTTAGTSAYAIGSYFEKWFYKAYNVVNQQVRCGGYRFDALYKNYIIELKNYTWGKYNHYGTLIRSFTKQAAHYLDFVGKQIDGMYIKGITFYFSSEPPIEIVQALEALGVIVEWVKGG